MGNHSLLYSRSLWRWGGEIGGRDRDRVGREREKEREESKKVGTEEQRKKEGVREGRTEEKTKGERKKRDKDVNNNRCSESISEQ